jgi:type III restriction enzyme
MLSEGWDAKTVTHIMGLRAFSSQLLCEQVVGRGLRRTAYDMDDKGLFRAEYVNVFGVPFTFLPHEGGDDAPPPPPTPKTRIELVRTKAHLAISWPNIIRIDRVYQPRLRLDLAEVPALVLNASEKIENAEMAAVVAGKPNLAMLTEIDLNALAQRFRLQRIIFEVARDVYDQIKPNWNGDREALLAQAIRLVEQFISSSKMQINPPEFYQDELRWRVMLTLNMGRIVQHVFEQIRFANTQALEAVFDSNKPIRSTGDMLPWFTGKPCEVAKRSHINFVVVDSTWESNAAQELDSNAEVAAWVKSDHLGFEVTYIFEGLFHKFRPDYLILLINGINLVLEVKGQDSPKDRAKRDYLDEWFNAVNAHGGFGTWRRGVCMNPSDLAGVIHGAFGR